jgi:YYY domain-containing protein
MNDTQADQPPKRRAGLRSWVYGLLLIYIFLMAAYLRFVGINWGDEQYLHPDERFLVWVGSDISPVKSLGEYFDTAVSLLNPNNRGHGFFVYGTLPLFMARYLVEWIFGHSGFNEMTLVGRPLSALADLGTLTLVFMIALRLYNRRAALLASAFYACAVLPIQLSHFYKEDTFTNFFSFLAIYFAVRVADQGPVPLEPGQADAKGNPFIRYLRQFSASPLFLYSIGFGFALGCAVASKLTAVPVAGTLVVGFAAMFAREGQATLRSTEGQRKHLDVVLYLVLAALVSLFVFRVFQPYAFSGPGFFGIKLNPQWEANIHEQRAQSTGDVDFPPALQWARRSHLFSFDNIVLWGLGLPLGILAWAGFLWAGWRILKGDWQPHYLLWTWTAFFFIWQSLAHNPTMRYQLPIYPALTIFAGWMVVRWYDKLKQTHFLEDKWSLLPHKEFLALGVGSLVFAATLAWAFAFTRIYTRPVSRVSASHWIFQNVPGPINLHIDTSDGLYNQPLPFQASQTIDPVVPFTSIFTANASGSVKQIYLPHVVDLNASPGEKILKLSLHATGDNTPDHQGRITSGFTTVQDPRGGAYTFLLDEALNLVKGDQYQITISLPVGGGEIALSGSAPANESSWDDGLPLRVDGYDGYGGIYQNGLNFEMYWDDNTDKLVRFVNTMEQADYIFISSNRQWATTTRVPERYPLTIDYYRNLLGCPADNNLIWCYRVAEPGMFQGSLGFDLVKVFESYPNLGSFRINDQFAEEAFTVYDHPKVFIFQKSDSFDPAKVTHILGEVNLSEVIHVTPLQASKTPGNLMLPLERWTEQQAGGTWAILFNTQALINRSQVFSVIFWYLAVMILGWVVYPLVRRVFSGFSDGGYPLTRILGLLLLSYLVWLAGSFRVPFTRLTITTVFAGLLAVNGLIAFHDRVDLFKELSSRKKYYLMIEGLFLAFFIIDLSIRIGNPDLWHPWKGGEKPMDFSYFNAVLKSTSFPPYDPWYAGGYLNYYYYGFVLVGVLVKWLGIVPAVAYNLILPTIFALIALGAFCIGWNLLSRNDSSGSGYKFRLKTFTAGIAGSLGMAVFGNLGMVRMIFQGYQKVAAPGGMIEGANLFTRWGWAIQGFLQVLGGASLPYGLGDWYWIPSRAIPAPNEVEPITEFPFFTVLYGDPHAHLFALPLSLLVLAIALAVIKSRGGWVKNGLLTLLVAGLAIGVLRPTNTWDYYTYLAVGCVVIAYSLWSHFMDEATLTFPGISLPFLDQFSFNIKRFVRTTIGVIALAFLSWILFLPYIQWYGQGYSHIDIWHGSHTPLSAYLTHWGLFLFVIVSWMVWETREWMATTPLSSLRKLEPYKGLILFLLALLIIIIVMLSFILQVSIAWFVLSLAAWSGVLILRPGQSDTKRFVLFIIGTGLVLTLMVEIIVLRGDIARMNTVFKFYLQVWTLFAVCAAGCLGWLIGALPGWKPGWRGTWQATLLLLAAAAALYPLLASAAKIKDRMTNRAPHTLDGMAYMAYAEYAETWGVMDLSQDYRAIRWMQENIQASPVIVEGNQRNLYRWGSRFSIYTGLPGVVGWEWHQQQQRALLPGTWVSNRIDEIDDFYRTTDFQRAMDFLNKYNVKYIVVGQQERGLYPGPGLDKFPAANSLFWKEVYHDGPTVIYEVIGNPVK